MSDYRTADQNSIIEQLQKEIAILKKYFGDDDYFGQFRNLTDFISEKEEDDEDY